MTIKNNVEIILHAGMRELGYQVDFIIATIEFKNKFTNRTYSFDDLLWIYDSHEKIKFALTDIGTTTPEITPGITPDYTPSSHYWNIPLDNITGSYIPISAIQSHGMIGNFYDPFDIPEDWNDGSKYQLHILVMPVDDQNGYFEFVEIAPSLTPVPQDSIGSFNIADFKGKNTMKVTVLDTLVVFENDVYIEIDEMDITPFEVTPTIVSSFKL